LYLPRAFNFPPNSFRLPFTVNEQSRWPFLCIVLLFFFLSGSTFCFFGVPYSTFLASAFPLQPPPGRSVPSLPPIEFVLVAHKFFPLRCAPFLEVRSPPFGLCVAVSCVWVRLCLPPNSGLFLNTFFFSRYLFSPSMFSVTRAFLITPHVFPWKFFFFSVGPAFPLSLLSWGFFLPTPQASHPVHVRESGILSRPWFPLCLLVLSRSL